MFIPSVEFLKLMVEFIVMKRNSFDNLIDGLFSCFRPKSVTVESVDNCHDEFTKVCVCFQENLVSNIIYSSAEL